MVQLGKVCIYPVALRVRGHTTIHVNSHSHSSSILALGERHCRALPRARELITIKVSISTLDDEMISVSVERPSPGKGLCDELRGEWQGIRAAAIQAAERPACRRIRGRRVWRSSACLVPNERLSIRHQGSRVFGVPTNYSGAVEALRRML